MTQAEAYNVLGISDSIRRSKAEPLYRQKCRKLRLQMVPGMPVAARQKAQAELAKVDTAWQVIGGTSHPIPAKKPAAKKAADPSRTTAFPHPKPRTLGEAWGQVASMMPFPEPVTAIGLALALLLTMMALLASL